MRHKMMIICVVVLAINSTWAGTEERLTLSDEMLAEAQHLWQATHLKAYSGDRNDASNFIVREP